MFLILFSFCVLSPSSFLNRSYIPDYGTPASPRYGSQIASIPILQSNRYIYLHFFYGGIDKHNNYCTDIRHLLSLQNKNNIFRLWSRFVIDSEVETPARLKAAFVPFDNSYFAIPYRVLSRGKREFFRIFLSVSKNSIKIRLEVVELRSSSQFCAPF